MPALPAPTGPRRGTSRVPVREGPDVGESLARRPCRPAHPDLPTATLCLGPSKMPKIQLKIKRCQQPGAGNKTAKTSTSPRKAGRHRRPSTTSNGPSDGSGRQPRVSSQGEVRVTVPNDTDPLRDGPID